jgi:hypothetical protein
MKIGRLFLGFVFSAIVFASARAEPVLCDTIFDEDEKYYYFAEYGHGDTKKEALQNAESNAKEELNKYSGQTLESSYTQRVGNYCDEDFKDYFSRNFTHSHLAQGIITSHKSVERTSDEDGEYKACVQLKISHDDMEKTKVEVKRISEEYNRTRSASESNVDCKKMKFDSDRKDARDSQQFKNLGIGVEFGLGGASPNGISYVNFHTGINVFITERLSLGLHYSSGSTWESAIADELKDCKITIWTTSCTGSSLLDIEQEIINLGTNASLYLMPPNKYVINPYLTADIGYVFASSAEVTNFPSKPSTCDRSNPGSDLCRAAAPYLVLDHFYARFGIGALFRLYHGEFDGNGVGVFFKTTAYFNGETFFGLKTVALF